GAGSFSPNEFNMNPTYTPTAGEIAAGSITLTLTSAGNGNCNPEEDEVTITFSPTPVVNAGNDANICSNNADIQLAGSVSVAIGGVWSGGTGSFDPAPNSLSAVYTPSQDELNDGSVTLTLTSSNNGNCLPVSDLVTYTFTPTPTANAGANQSICINNADDQLSGSVTIQTGGQWIGGLGSLTDDSFDWNAVDTPTPTELNAGTLTLTLVTTGNGNCSPVSDQVTITFTPRPTV